MDINLKRITSYIIVYPLLLIILLGCGTADNASVAGNSIPENVTFESIIDENVIYEPDSRVINTGFDEDVIIQLGDTVLILGEATIKDFIEAGAHFNYEDIATEDVLEWTSNANQLEIILYIGNTIEITCNRADFGEEKKVGDCIVGGVEVRFYDLDVLTTDINSLAECNSIIFNGGVRFRDTLENALSAYGTPKRDFTADYGELSVRQLDFESDNNHGIYCQVKDGRIYCFIAKI